MDKIPEGLYCYKRISHIKIKLCPYWSRRDDKPEQENGYCSYLKIGDWDIPLGLLWDQVKECEENINYDIDDIEDK